jgi:hypothetical protein
MELEEPKPSQKSRAPALLYPENHLDGPNFEIVDFWASAMLS